MQSEHIQNFQERLNQWVANQGFWFQIRHSVIGGGFGGKVMFHIFRMTLRLALFLLLVAIGSWIFLFQRIESKKFHESFENSLRQALSVSDLAMSATRTRDQLQIPRLGAEGGPQTFFSSLEARNISYRMGLLDGLFGTWDPGVISISRLDINLRAGADDPESAARMANVIFSQPPDVLVHSFDVTNTNLRWGYSARTYGSITSSQLKMRRIDSGWRLVFKGGTFSQNWLKGLEIIQMTVICEPDGLIFEDAQLRAGQSTIDFSGLRVKANERPIVSGTARIKNLDLETILPTSYHEVITGSISTELAVSGSTNSSEGIAFEGMVALDGTNTISLRDRIHILKALSVMDYSRQYHRVNFNEGSFRFQTIGGGLHVKDIQLRADDHLTLNGEIAVRLPNNDEVREAVQKGLFSSSSDFFGAIPETQALMGGGNTDFTLRRAANETKQTRDGMRNPDALPLFDRLDLGVENQKLEMEATNRLSHMLRFQGEIVLTLAADAFERAPNLRKKYPVNLDIGRIPILVPINGSLGEITLSQAEYLYEEGQR